MPNNTGSTGLNMREIAVEAAVKYMKENENSFKDLLVGELKGEAGRNVHHLVHKKSLSPDGKEIAAVGYAKYETDPTVKSGTPGYVDIYDAYADEEEKTHVGHIRIANGNGAFEGAVKNGYKGTAEEFYSALISIAAKTMEAKKQAWIAEAQAKTAESFAKEPEDQLVKAYTSNGDGTFKATDMTGIYSTLHYDAKAKKKLDLMNTSGTVRVVETKNHIFALNDLVVGDTALVKNDGNNKWAVYTLKSLPNGSKLGADGEWIKVIDETWLEKLVALDAEIKTIKDDLVTKTKDLKDLKDMLTNQDVAKYTKEDQDLLKWLKDQIGKDNLNNLTELEKKNMKSKECSCGCEKKDGCGECSCSGGGKLEWVYFIENDTQANVTVESENVDANGLVKLVIVADKPNVEVMVYVDYLDKYGHRKRIGHGVSDATNKAVVYFNKSALDSTKKVDILNVIEVNGDMEETYPIQYEVKG